MKKFFIFISIFILTIFIGENKDSINFKLAFLNKEFKYIRYDDWLNYNNTKLNVKKYNKDKLLINIKSKNLNFIENEFEEVKFELQPKGNIKFYFLCNRNYLKKIIDEKILDKNKEITYLLGSTENNIKETIINKNWLTHNNSNFENIKNEITINYDNPGYSSHIHNFFEHDSQSFLVLNFKAKIEKNQNNNFFTWIGDHYRSDRKRMKQILSQNYNEYYLFHNNKFFSSNKKKFVGFDFRSKTKNIIYLKDLKLNKIDIKRKLAFTKLTRENLSNENFFILVIEFKNLGKNDKIFNLINPV